MNRVAPLVLVLFAAAAPAGRAAPPGDAHVLDSTEEALARVVPVVAEAMGVEPAPRVRVQELSFRAAAAAFEADMRAEVERRYPTASPAQRATFLEAAGTASVRSCVARYSTTLSRIVLVRFGFDEQVAALGLDGEGAKQLLVAALAHECVHAFDDVRFGLAAKRAAASDREALRALSMVIEGRATWFGGAAARELGVPAEIREIRPGGDELEGEREAFLGLAYRRGERFVGALVARDGVALADRALESPPALTHLVCQPDRWPDGMPDERPDRVLGAAFPDAERRALSELELRARYTAMDGVEEAEALFAGYRGGARALVRGTNAAVLAFATEEDAERFLVRSKREVPARRAGTIVVRAAGAAPEEIVARLVEHLP